ncbi:hypothetical protein NTGM5_140019 [Candidatus Nitrotoga sp. M5]|nr:hypothetical protein NTGM5_140019 [Candidatus Nitrotoga sp. M5]
MIPDQRCMNFSKQIFSMGDLSTGARAIAVLKLTIYSQNKLVIPGMLG